MLNPDDLYLAKNSILSDERLRDLPLVVAFSSPQDAGATAGQFGTFLLDNLKHVAIAEFDSDQLHDYRARRPHIVFNRDHFEDPVFPKLKLYVVEDSLDKPFLLLTGSEPDFQWQRFQQAMLGIAQRLQPSLVVFISAFPMPVPHTRPVPVTAHGSRKDLIDGISAWRPKAELHANMTNLLEVLFTEHGFDTVGFGVNVPQYISDADLPQGTLAALEYVTMATRLSLPTDQLREAARTVHGQINEQMGQHPEVQSMVSSYEENYDANYRSSNMLIPLSQRDADKVLGRDEIGALFEQFLHERE